MEGSTHTSAQSSTADSTNTTDNGDQEPTACTAASEAAADGSSPMLKQRRMMMDFDSNNKGSSSREDPLLEVGLEGEAEEEVLEEEEENEDASLQQSNSPQPPTTTRTRSSSSTSATASLPPVARAIPQDDEDLHPRAIPEADVIHMREKEKTEKEKQKRRKRLCMGLALAALFILVAAIMVPCSIFLLKVNNNRGTDEASTPTMNPTSYRESIGIQHYIADYFENYQLMYDHNGPNHPSPYYYQQALDWILHKDEMQLDFDSPDQLIQRFIMAYFYLQGSQKGPWNFCNPPQTQEEPQQCYYKFLKNPKRSPWSYGDNILAMKWLSNAHECQWAGVQCSSDGIITDIDIGTLRYLYHTHER